MKPLLSIILCVLFFSGCATQFSEQHLYRIKNAKTGKTLNYMRLRIEGWAGFTSAKYVSGYYDKNALETFFNNAKLGKCKTESVADTKSKAKIAETTKGVCTGLAEELDKPGIELEPVDKKGVLALVLSTNASAITNAIGAFTENEIVANALTNLVNAEKISKAAKINAEFVDTKGLATSLQGELQALFDAVPGDKENATSDVTTKAYLRILSALSRSSGGPSLINNFDEAKGWLATIKD